MKLTRLKDKGLPFFSLDQARRCGVSSSLLAHYLKKGLVERVSHGLYRFPGEGAIDFESLIREKLKTIPQGIIGYQTAIRLYGLTDELPGEIDIVVPETNIPKRKLEDVALHTARTDLYQLDTKKIRDIPVTSLERTLVDLLRSGSSMSQAIAIYNEAKLKKIPFSLTKLKKLGETFRAKQKVANFIGAVL